VADEDLLEGAAVGQAAEALQERQIDLEVLRRRADGIRIRHHAEAVQSRRGIDHHVLVDVRPAAPHRLRLDDGIGLDDRDRIEGVAGLLAIVRVEDEQLAVLHLEGDHARAERARGAVLDRAGEELLQERGEEPALAERLLVHREVELLLGRSCGHTERGERCALRSRIARARHRDEERFTVERAGGIGRATEQGK
jgi:hypothetical protein